MGRLSGRVEGLTHDLASFRKETAQKFEETIQTLRQETAQEIQALRQETTQRIDQQGSALQKQIYALADQIAANERKDEKFRSDMLKEYELFHQEKAAQGGRPGSPAK